MKRFYLSDASQTPPTPPVNPSYGYPQDGNRSNNKLPTAIGAYWFHMITEEFMAVIEGNGLTPDETNLHQLQDIFAAFKQTAQSAATSASNAESSASAAAASAEAAATRASNAASSAEAAAGSAESAAASAAESAADVKRAADAAGQVVAAGLSIVDGKLCVTFMVEE